MVVAALLGILLGALAMWLAIRVHRSAAAASVSPPGPTAPQSSEQPGSTPMGTAEVHRLFEAIPGAVILVNSSTGLVQLASREAFSMGLVIGDRIAVNQIASMVGDVNRGASVRNELLEVRRNPFSTGRLDLQTCVAPLTKSTAVILAEDVSSTRRVDDVRRDFVVNVSHELKTPVGALSLLSEAVIAAADEPDEVRHFADRMRVESARLSHLVGDLVDLSRLQGDDPMREASEVEVDRVVAEALDAMRTTAQAKDIEIVTGGEHGLVMHGVEGQLTTALRNLLSNAVNYSGDRTRVAVGTRLVDDFVEITVTDQGIGIPSNEIDRVFERFYRVDQARSRVTGGTGLGLSIVKHVCQNHGGNVSVWSVEGEGSTFTLRLPCLEYSRRQLAEVTDLAQRSNSGGDQ